MLSLHSASLAFAPGAAPTLRAAAAGSAAPAVSMVEYSASIPFLKKPPALDGSMPGDVGFDPMGFTTTITELGGDLNYVREAELMHGRQAMLACVGMVAPKLFGKLSTCSEVSTNPLVAQYELPTPVFYQLVISIFIAEALRSRIIYDGDSSRAPGDHGFDPIFKGAFLKTPEEAFTMKTKEVLNGRLAMIAFVGMVAQEAVTGSIWPLI